MRRMIGVTVAVVLVAGLATAAMAEPGWGPMGRGMGGGMGMMGGGMGMMQGGGPGGGGCAGRAAGQQGEAITEERATALANEYVARHFQGYTVERVLPVQGRFHTMYEVELKGPAGEKRMLHVNPWGGVRPFGPLATVR